MKGLENLIKISQFYGKNPEMVIAGGGNTSYKNDENIWVKASGHALATITEDGFAKLDRKKLGVISEKTYSADPFERERQIKDDLMEATITKDRRPSVETSMHDVIEYAYVVHLHPTKVNGLMCGSEVEKYLEELFGDQVVYIPYIDPGYVLFKEVEKQLAKFKAEKGKAAQIIFLQNHGIFVAANSVDEIETIYNDVFAKLNAALKEELSEEALPIRDDIAEFIPAIRMMVSEEEIKTLKLRDNAVIAQFAKDAAAFENQIGLRVFVSEGVFGNAVVFEELLDLHVLLSTKGASLLRGDFRRVGTAHQNLLRRPTKISCNAVGGTHPTKATLLFRADDKRLLEFNFADFALLCITLPPHPRKEGDPCRMQKKFISVSVQFAANSTNIQTRSSITK